jgi:hypothetical protein
MLKMSRFVVTANINKTTTHGISKRLFHIYYICTCGGYPWLLCSSLLTSSIAPVFVPITLTFKSNDMQDQSTEIQKDIPGYDEFHLTAMLQSGSFFLPDLLALANSADTEKECCDNLLSALRDNQKQGD